MPPQMARNLIRMLLVLQDRINSAKISSTVVDFEVPHQYRTYLVASSAQFNINLSEHVKCINNLREKFSPGPGFEPGVAQLAREPALRARDPCSNPGPGENFSLKLLIYDLPDGYSES